MALSCNDRIELLQQTKLQQSAEKRRLALYKQSDFDSRMATRGQPDENLITKDKGFIPCSEEFDFQLKPNHPSGGTFGALAVGSEFKRFLAKHPTYIDPINTLAGGYMFFFHEYFTVLWKPEIFYSHLVKKHDRYGQIHGIAGGQHLVPDLKIGLDLGWSGLLEKVNQYREVNNDKSEFYDGLESVITGIQDFIQRHAEKARSLAQTEERATIRDDLLKMATINEKLICEPPATFREACQFMSWLGLTQALYNASSSIGRIDDYLYPYYKNDIEAGILTDEEAILHLCSLLVKDDAYYDLGALNENGEEITNKVSWLMLEAQHKLNKVPCHVSVSYHEKLNPNFFRKSVQYLLEDNNGQPNYMGQDVLTRNFIESGHTLKQSLSRAKAGCHWFGIPGREYTLNDVIKINLPKVFEVALYDMAADSNTSNSVAALEKYYEKHLRKAVFNIAESIDWHVRYKHEIFPELLLDLFCHGPLEKGVDLTHGSLELYNFGVDGAGIGTVADSFAAIKTRIEDEKRMTWDELFYNLQNDWPTEFERMLMWNIPRFGTGGSAADDYGTRMAKLFSDLVLEKPTPDGYKMLPGLFSWLNTVSMGYILGATPNGRHAGTPISFSTLPESGLTAPASLTARTVASAQVQCAGGNPSPIHVELEPSAEVTEEMIDKMEDYIKGAFKLGNTELNITFVDHEKILEAYEDPEKHPDLIVRVTGFSAYFAALSKEGRKLVVDRLLPA